MFRPVPGMVTFARVLAFLPLTLILLGIGIGWTAAIERGVSMAEAFALVALILFWLFVAVRGVMLRVEVSRDQLRVVQWFRTTSVDLADIDAVFVLGYVGFLNWGGIGPSLGLSGTVQLATKSNGALKLRWFNATIALGSSADRKAERLRSAITAQGFKISAEVPERMTFA